MARKRQTKDENTQQLSIFDVNIDDQYESTDQDDDFDDNEDLELNFEPSNRDIEQEREFITYKLLKEAIIQQHPDDAVMTDFAEYVLPNLLQVTIGVTAKGGKWIEEKEREKKAQGKELDRRNAADQSLNTHIINGLFPANIIERRLKKMNTTVKRVIHEFERRIEIAAFILHDFEKFDFNRFEEMPTKYKSIKDIRKLSIEEHREILKVIITRLKLDVFINPENSNAYEEYLDDLLFIAYNAQTRWDTNWNLSEYNGLSPKFTGDKLNSLAYLACLADRLSSIVKHPSDATHSGLNDILGILCKWQLKFTYHRISENRGVLTNIVNNALIDEFKSLNYEDLIYYEPLLYLPTGVIYLASRNAPSISDENISKRVVEKIKSLCADELKKRQTGFSRDGKGMKYAEYYHLFFDTPSLMEVGLDATLKILREGKKSVAQDRSNNLIKFQKQGILSADYDFQFKDDIRIDQIAEFGDLISRKIWEVKVQQIEIYCKQNKEKNLPKLPTINIIEEVAKFWKIKQDLPQIKEIQNINEGLKQKKLKGNTGGVPYEWYYLAAKYLEHNPGIENVRPVCSEIINHISQLIEPILEPYILPDGWDDLRLWIKQVVMLPEQDSSILLPSKFLEELEAYKMAKKSGRGKQLICSISHSAYTVTEQMESSVLFTPQVYTNKQMLGGSNAKRNISSIAGLEMMLRQILMSQTEAIGAKFEDAKYRYLYFYPTYYCTPETNTFLHKAYDTIKQTRFDTGIRNHFISTDLKANFALENYQSVDIFYLNEDVEQKRDRIFKLSYPEKQPLTFYFMALPPEVKGKDKKPTDTESWIMPAWLALAFPMILDVKMVVSESPIPPFNDGAEFEETVFLDSAPPALRILTKQDRFRLDYLLEGWKDEQENVYPAPLNSLTAAYAIHLDVNAKQGKGGYDPNWGKLTELAKDFETSPLYIFAYLNNWVRKQKIDVPSLSKIKLYAYYFYPCFDAYVTYDFQKEILIVEQKSPINHPKELTKRYREFYRAKSSKGKPTKANAILKPIDEAASVILSADLAAFQGESLVDAVAAKLFKLMDRVHQGTAEGRWVIAERAKERELILDFAQYFVVDVFEKSFNGDRARLAGRQLNLIRDTCEFLYRLEQDKDNKKRKAQGEFDGDNSDSDDSEE